MNSTPTPDQRGGPLGTSLDLEEQGIVKSVEEISTPTGTPIPLKQQQRKISFKEEIDDGADISESYGGGFRGSNRQGYQKVAPYEPSKAAHDNRPDKRRASTYARAEKREKPAEYVCSHKFMVQVAILIHVVGAMCLVAYSIIAAKLDPLNRGITRSVLPGILHLIGVGSMVASDIFYENHTEVGFLQSMHLMIRGRLWMFPGILGKVTEIKRSEIDVAKGSFSKEKVEGDDEDSGDEDPMLLNDWDFEGFLERCQFPEFRCLLRAVKGDKQWGKVRHFHNAEKRELLAKEAKASIDKVFPILDVLSCVSILPTLINPFHWARWVLAYGAYFTGRSNKAHRLEEVGKGKHVLRSEEIEVDDMSPAAAGGAGDSDRAAREGGLSAGQEPTPWGTLRLTDSSERFNWLYHSSNLLGFVTLCCSVVAYLTMIVGEVRARGGDLNRQKTRLSV